MASLTGIMEKGRAHHLAGRLSEAESLYRRALAHNPAHATALGLLGVLFCQNGRPADGVQYLKRSLQVRPHQAAEARAFSLNNLGNALRMLGGKDPRIEAEAVASYREALRLYPQYPEAWNNLGKSLASAGETSGAIEAFEQSLSVRPDSPQSLHSLASALYTARRYPEALGYLEHALRLQPNFPGALSDWGLIMADAGELEKGLDAVDRALGLDPQMPEALNIRGHILRCLGRLPEATASFEAAIRARPLFPDALANLAGSLFDSGRPEEGELALSRAFTIDPGHAESHFTLGCYRLLQGDFERGWPEYEWRNKRRDSPPVRFSEPRWDGAPLNGRSILLVAEQGLGDTLQFIRYAKLVKDRGGNVIVECQPRLERLLYGVDGIDRIVAAGGPLPAFDVWLPLLSLPGVLGVVPGDRGVPGDAPVAVPYLRVAGSPGREGRPAGGRLRVGLAWAGSPRYKSNRTRSLSLSRFAPLGGLENVEFYSLQRGPAAGETPPDGLRLVNLEREDGGIEDTAAALMDLDLLITTDSMPAHLAGALGRPVWTLLPFSPDFRWMLNREDSPWYPSMRLFRQTSPGDWEGVMARVAAALAELAGAPV